MRARHFSYAEQPRVHVAFARDAACPPKKKYMGDDATRKTKWAANSKMVKGVGYASLAIGAIASVRSNPMFFVEST